MRDHLVAHQSSQLVTSPVGTRQPSMGSEAESGEWTVPASELGASRWPAHAQSSLGQPLNSVCSNCALAPNVNESSLEPGLNYQAAPAPEAAHIWPGSRRGAGLGLLLWLTAGPPFTGVIFTAACTRAGMSELGGHFHLCFLGNINLDVLSCSVSVISPGRDRPALPIIRRPRWVPGQGPAPTLALIL